LLSLQLQPTTGLSTESVQSAALAFQSIDDVHGCDGLSLGVLGVGDCITDDVLKEDLQNTASLLVDQTRDTLDTTSASQTTDGWLRDALDVVTQHLSVTLRASFSESLSSFASSRHGVDQMLPHVEVMTSKAKISLYMRSALGSTDPAEELTCLAQHYVARTHVFCRHARVTVRPYA
jgi:hypothetical protein